MTTISSSTSNSNNEIRDTSNNISIEDIIGLLQIIDLASKRGAFAGSELGKIGSLYDKISNVIKSVENQKK